MHTQVLYVFSKRGECSEFRKKPGKVNKDSFAGRVGSRRVGSRGESPKGEGEIQAGGILKGRKPQRGGGDPGGGIQAKESLFTFPGTFLSTHPL